MEDESKAAIVRGWFKDQHMIQVLNGEEMNLLVSIIEFCMSENTEDALAEALMDIDAENCSLWLSHVQEAMKAGGEKEVVFRNAIGFLLQFREECWKPND